MSRGTLLCSVVLFASTSIGCGDGADRTQTQPTENGGSANLGGSGGSMGGSGGSGGQTVASGTEIAGGWKYATDDEGVFPKDRVLNIDIKMANGAWENLIATAKLDSVWSTAEVTIDGQKLGSIGLRPKGEYSLDSCVSDTGQLTCDKLSLKLKFNEIDPDGRFYGLKKLALNQITDGAAVFMETTAYQLFKDFGIVAPRTSYATVTVNGKSQGIYTVVEVVDGRFTSRHFEEGNGNLYKEAWPEWTDEAYFSEALETNEETATHEAVIAFATDMLSATDDVLPSTLAKYMDLDKTLDYMAVDYAIANWDGITAFYAGTWGHMNHNFYLYQSETAAKFTLIPWDLNATFFLDHWLGNVQPWDTLDVDCSQWVPNDGSTELFTIPATCDPTIRAIALAKDGYHASVQRLLDEVFVVDKLNNQVDRYAKQVSSAMASDPFVSPAEVTGGANYMKGQFPVLRARLEAVLAN